MNKNHKIRKKFPQVFVHADSHYQDLLLEQRLLPLLVDPPTTSIDVNQTLTRPHTSGLESSLRRPMSTSRGDFNRGYRPMLPMSAHQALLEDYLMTGRSSMTDSQGGDRESQPNNQSYEPSIEDSQSSASGFTHEAMELMMHRDTHHPRSSNAAISHRRQQRFSRPMTSSSVSGSLSLYEQQLPPLDLATQSYIDPQNSLTLQGNGLLRRPIHDNPNASISNQRQSLTNHSHHHPTSKQRPIARLRDENVSSMEKEEMPMVIHSLNAQQLKRDLANHIL